MKPQLPPARYFVYVLLTVDGIMAGIFLAWTFALEAPGVEVVVPVMLAVSVISAWVVMREFSRPA